MGIKVKLKQFHQAVIKPFKKHDQDLGFDCFVTERKIKRFLFIPIRVDYKFGFGYDIDDYTGFLAFPRSSVRDRYLTLSNSVGVLDPLYRGEICASFYPSIISMLPWIRRENGKLVVSANRFYQVGDRALQIIPFTNQMPYNVEFEFGQVSESERGEGGFGSTGLK